MSRIGILCSVVGYDPVEFDEDNFNDFELIAVLWQEFVDDENPSDQLPRIYYHLFESLTCTDRICLANVVDNEEKIDHINPSNTHFYNINIIPWILQLTDNDDVKKIAKDLEEAQSSKTSKAVQQLSPQALLQVREKLSNKTIKLLMQPLAEKYMSDVREEKVIISPADLLPYLELAFTMGQFTAIKTKEMSEDFDVNSSKSSQ